MQNYLDLLRTIKYTGEPHKNRTGIQTQRITGAMLRFNVGEAFPAMTTKKLAFSVVAAELIGFLRGYTSAADFRKLGCKIWDANANENKAWLENPNRSGEDDLGRIYGAQWRLWSGRDQDLDQIFRCVRSIERDPESRRNIVTAWQPAELEQMALPPCHLLFQCHVNEADSTLSMTMYQRSCDMFLGVPFNIASYALLLSLIAKATNLKPKTLVMFLADAHIYDNHKEQVDAQLARRPMAPAKLVIPDKLDGESAMEYLMRITPDDIRLMGYQSHPALPAPMAV